MKSLWASRKFKALLGDIVFSNLVYFATNFLNPELSGHVLWLIASWQPAVMFFILGTAWEDAAQKSRLEINNVVEAGPEDDAPVK